MKLKTLFYLALLNWVGACSELASKYLKFNAPGNSIAIFLDLRGNRCKLCFHHSLFDFCDYFPNLLSPNSFYSHY